MLNRFRNRIALFGGTFNPIHYGHLRVAEEVRERLFLKKVVFIPAADPPLKGEDLAPSDKRFRMVQMAIRDNPHFEASPVEMERGGKSYTVFTLRELKSCYDEELVFLLGLDAFVQLHEWYRFEEVLSLTDFLIVGRPGEQRSRLIDLPWVVEVKGVGDKDAAVFIKGAGEGRFSLYLDTMKLDISATEIRRLVKAGKSIRYLLPDDVAEFIRQNRLYQIG